MGVLGNRAAVRYIGDDGGNYYIEQLAATGSAVGNTGPSTGAVPFPKHWKPRVIHAQSSSDPTNKITIVVGDATNALWTSDDPDTFSVNYEGLSVNYTVTGRRGERRSRLLAGL